MTDHGGLACSTKEPSRRGSGWESKRRSRGGGMSMGAVRGMEADRAADSDARDPGEE